MKRILLLMLIVSIAFSCSKTTSTDVSTTIEAPVDVKQVELGSIENIETATGTLYPYKEVTLTSEISGDYYLSKNKKTGQLFKLGDKVEKGEVIVELKNEELKNGIKYDYQKLNVENLKREYEQQLSLHKKGGVTLTSVKQAEQNYINAKVALKDAELQLEKFNIKALFSGVIVDIPYHTDGVKLSSGVEIVKIMNYETLKLNINIPSTLLKEIKPGLLVRAMNYNYPDKKRDGVISELSPALDQVTRTVKAVVTIKNDDLFLLPGMFVKVEIITEKKDNVIVVPKNIIVNRRGRKAVYVVDRSYARERYIKTGLGNNEQVEVTEGLSKDDRIVIKGYETLSNRTRVKITKTEKRDKKWKK